MKRFFRRIALVLLSVVVVAAVTLAVLLSTTAGARWLAGLAEDLIPELSLEVVSGTVATGVVLRDVVWRSATVDVAVARVATGWRPGCLLEARLCVDRLHLRGIRVAVAAGDTAGQTEAPAPKTMVLPLAIRLADIRVEDVEVRVADGPRVELDRLTGRAFLGGSRLTLEDVALRGLAVRVPEGGPAEAPASAPAMAAAPVAAAITLPTVRLPVNVAVRGLTLRDARLIRGEMEQPLDSLQLTGDLTGARLRLERLALSAPRGSLSVSGRIQLDAGYPLDLALRAQLPELLAGQPVTVDAALAGSVADLEVTATASGALDARLQGTVQPLQPTLPFQATLTADRLAWPLQGEAVVRAESIRLAVDGDRSRYAVTARAALDGPQVPAGDWSLEGDGDLGALRIESLTGRTLEGTIQASGRIGWADALRWQAGITLAGVNPGAYRADLPGHLSGRLTTRGALAEGELTLSAEAVVIGGALRGYPVRLTGAVELGEDGHWTFDDVRLASGANRLHVDGELGERWQARLRLQAPELEALWPGLSGSLDGTVRISGPAAAPTLGVELAGSGAGYDGITTRSLSVAGSIDNVFRAESRLRLDAAGLRVGERVVGDVVVAINGTRGEHRVTLEVTDGPVGARLALSGALQGDTTAWRGRLADAVVQLADGSWRLADPTAITWDPKSSVVEVVPFCWRRDGATLCSRTPLTAGAGRADASLALDGYRLAWLAPWLPDGIDWEGPLAAEAVIRWRGETLPRVELSLRSEGGEVTLAGVGESPLALSYRRLTAALTLEREQAVVRLSLDSETLGDAEAEIRVDPTREPRPISGSVALSGLGLAPLRPFLPALAALQGELRARGDLSGTLSEPRFDGEVALRDGRVGLRATPTTLENITLTARIRGHEAGIDGGFRSGRGDATITGRVDWGDGLHVDLSLTGANLDVAYPPFVKAEISPDLQLTVDPGTILVAGRVDIPRGRITLEELPAGTAPLSDDVVIVDDQTTQQSESAAGDDDRDGWAIRSNVEVVLGDDVRLRGFGAEGRLTGALELKQVGAGGVVADGEISLVEGQFEAYGQELEIRTGRLIFSGPVTSPDVLIEAVRRAGSVTAGIRVTGRAEQPEVTLFSEPPMPQQDVLSYLLTGRPPGGTGPSQEMLAAQAALSLGVFGGQNVGEAVAERLGVEKFQLESTDEGQVAVSGYIAPNLLVRYGVGVFTPENTLTLRYSLTERLYLEATSGLESALDIFYSFDF